MKNIHVHFLEYEGLFFKDRSRIIYPKDWFRKCRSGHVPAHIRQSQGGAGAELSKGGKE